MLADRPARSKPGMNAPKAVIAEDEPVLRAGLSEALASLWPELEVRAESPTA